MLNFYRRILNWRKQHQALIGGDIEFLDTAEPVLAFRRTAPEGNIAYVFNLSRDELTVGIGNIVQVDPLSQGALLEGNKLTLGANGYAVLLEREGSALTEVTFGRRRKRGRRGD